MVDVETVRTKVWNKLPSVGTWFNPCGHALAGRSVEGLSVEIEPRSEDREPVEVGNKATSAETRSTALVTGGHLVATPCTGVAHRPKAPRCAGAQPSPPRRTLPQSSTAVGLGCGLRPKTPLKRMGESQPSMAAKQSLADAKARDSEAAKGRIICAKSPRACAEDHRLQKASVRRSASVPASRFHATDGCASLQALRNNTDVVEGPASACGQKTSRRRAEVPQHAPAVAQKTCGKQASVSQAAATGKRMGSEDLQALEIAAKRLEVQQLRERNKRHMERAAMARSSAGPSAVDRALDRATEAVGGISATICEDRTEKAAQRAHGAGSKVVAERTSQQPAEANGPLGHQPHSASRTAAAVGMTTQSACTVAVAAMSTLPTESPAKASVASPSKELAL